MVYIRIMLPVSRQQERMSSERTAMQLQPKHEQGWCGCQQRPNNSVTLPRGQHVTCLVAHAMTQMDARLSPLLPPRPLTSFDSSTMHTNFFDASSTICTPSTGRADERVYEGSRASNKHAIQGIGAVGVRPARRHTFSLSSAPPRPLTTCRLGSTSSAPSMARSSSGSSASVASGMPRPASAR